MIDEEIQQRAENGESSDEPMRAYHVVFRALRKEPDFKLPTSFASGVLARMTSRHSARDTYWLYAGIAACLIAMIVAVLMTGFKPNFGAFKFISGYPGFVTFAIACIIAIQWLDKKFVRKAT